MSIPLLQVCGAPSGGRGGCFCQWELKALTDRSRSDCVHEQVAKLGPVSRAAGMDCECPLYQLLAGESIITELDEQIVYDQLDLDESAVWSLLLASGYLTIKKYWTEERGLW